MFTGTSVAFGAMLDSDETSNQKEIITQVTETLPLIDYPVTVEPSSVGPMVKAVEVVAGPVLKTDAPEVGSIDWMAEQKIEKDNLKAEASKKQDELEAEIARLKKIADDTKNLNKVLTLVKKQVGKTPWVFGGSTPNAWDCSGLIRWAYAHLDIDLEHSASAQKNSGEKVTEPKIGDLVSFNYQSYGSAYHIGIYIGPDEMIHAGGKPGDKTGIRSIKNWAKSNGDSKVTYTRIIETNN